MKTATGEVIGLYLTEEIPRGMPFADTVEAIRAQGAIVYVPHPFDRMHSIPDPALLRRLVDQIDVLETYNARLYRDAYNREAERFAERHDLLAGAGSDAHVLGGPRARRPWSCRRSRPGVPAPGAGNGQDRAPPANLVYLQGLKWLRSARSRPGSAEQDSLPPMSEPGRDLRALPPRAIREINTLGEEIAILRADHPSAPVPVLGSGHPLADVFLLKYRAQPAEMQEGVAFFGRSGAAVLKSLRAPGRSIRCSSTARTASSAPTASRTRPHAACPLWLLREIAIVEPQHRRRDGR